MSRESDNGVMIPLAVVVLLIVIVFSIAVAIGATNAEVFNLAVFGAQIPVNATGLYLTGAGAMLVLVSALAMLRTGIRRESAKRARIRELQSTSGGRIDRKPATGETTKPTTTASGPDESNPARSNTASDARVSDRGMSDPEVPDPEVPDGGVSDRGVPDPEAPDPEAPDPADSAAANWGTASSDSAGAKTRGSGRAGSSIARSPAAASGADPDHRSPGGSTARVDRNDSPTNRRRAEAVGAVGGSDDRQPEPSDVGLLSATAGPVASATAAERQALLDEAEELTGDNSDR
jgi:uncharacterized membrane protein YciS (DUF1049 family)